MNNKKGFTLVEVISVFAILAIIMLIAFPNFSKMTNQAKSKYSNNTKVIIESAAKMYVNNNIEEVNTGITNSGSNGYCIPLGKLIAYEFLDSDSDFKDSNGDPIPDSRCVLVTKTTNNNGKTEYSYNLDTETESTEDYLPPVIKISGKIGDNDCSNNMTVTSLEQFENNCIVTAEDKPGNTNITVDGPSLSRGINEKKLLLEYNATDAAGNKAIPLKVLLTIE